jgi:hypothetical protein
MGRVGRPEEGLMSVVSSKKVRDLAAREAQLQLREIQVEIREAEFRNESDRTELDRLQTKQEMLRRTIEVCSNAVAKIPGSITATHQHEVLSLMDDAVGKLKKSVADNL